jgi:phage terminase small subunit
MNAEHLVAVKPAFEEEFCQGIANGNTVAATLRSMGVNHKSTMYWHLAKEPRVVKRIQELVAMRLSAAGVTAERTKREIARVAYADVRKIFDAEGRLLPVHEIDDDTAAAITSITVQRKNIGTAKEPEHVDVIKIRFASKMDALGLLAKHFKLINDDGDGVNAIASMLADRLNAAKTRVPAVREVEDVAHREVRAARLPLESETPETPPECFFDQLDAEEDEQLF